MNRAERIKSLLKTEFQPKRLELQDESHKHAGHAGASPEGETHYRLVIASEKFAGQTRVKSHQMIYALLEAEFQSGLHALAITVTSDTVISYP